jgi:hypothetical protein
LEASTSSTDTKGFCLQQITKLVGLETLPQKLVNMACNHTKWGWKSKIL